MDPDEAIKIVTKKWEELRYDRQALSAPQKTLHLISWLNFEVAHGGVYGWLINMGEYGPDTATALEDVDAHQCASIVREILSFFPDSKPAAEVQERVRQIMAVEDVAEPHWSDLGARLLAWPDDIYVLLQKFVDEHEADFT